MSEEKSDTSQTKGNTSECSSQPQADPFSKEVPKLLVAHYDQLKASGITDDVIRERGYESVLGKRHLEQLGFVPSQCRTPSLLIPSWGVEGTIVNYQTRPDSPRKNPQGKSIKYETKQGASNRFDIPPRCLKDIGNPEVPLWITEGAKKADALASRGLCAVNLPGVWAWRGKNEWGGKTLVADLDRIALNDRRVHFAFDSDVVTKAPVKAALERFAVHLTRKSAQVDSIILPQEGEAKVGIDDYLQTHTLEDALKLAIELEPPEVGEGTKRQVPGFVLPDEGVVAEMIVDEKGERKFVLAMGSTVRLVNEYPSPSGLLVPTDDRLVNSVVHFPTTAKPYDSQSGLCAEVKDFIHAYVEVPAYFEDIASLFVLMSWISDYLPNVSYLRTIGDPGTGKSRFLETVGNVCFRPIFASGAITAAPIFRILDQFPGTLVLDEADFKQSEAWSEIIKILNVGYKPNMPILRAEPQGKKWYPRGFSVFGPKIIATRARWKDEALESRCLTIEMSAVTRRDIPRVLPPSFYNQVWELRAKLLTFRLSNLLRLRGQVYPNEWVEYGLEPRLNELLLPLKALTDGDLQLAETVKDFIFQLQEQLKSARRESANGLVLKAIMDLKEADSELTIKAISNQAHEVDASHDLKPEKVGWITRRLKLPKGTSSGGRRIIIWDDEKMERLLQSYGLTPYLPKKTSEPQAPDTKLSSEVFLEVFEGEGQTPEKTSDFALATTPEVPEVFSGDRETQDADIFLPDGRPIRYRDVIALWNSTGGAKISDHPAEPTIWNLENEIENLPLDRLARVVDILYRDSRPNQPCYACNSVSWRQRPDGSWVCGRCHPQPVSQGI